MWEIALADELGEWRWGEDGPILAEFYFAVATNERGDRYSSGYLGNSRQHKREEMEQKVAELRGTDPVAAGWVRWFPVYGSDAYCDGQAEADCYAERHGLPYFPA